MFTVAVGHVSLLSDSEKEKVLLHSQTATIQVRLTMINNNFKYDSNIANVSGFNTGICFNDATAWGTPDLWFDHAIDARNCTRSCPLWNDKSLAIWGCDLTKVFQHFKAYDYLAKYQAKKPFPIAQHGARNTFAKKQPLTSK